MWGRQIGVLFGRSRRNPDLLIDMATSRCRATLANGSSRFIDKPINETGKQVSRIGLPREDSDIPCSRNPNVRQRRHQPSAGNVDVQHWQRTDPDAKTIFHCLAGDEKVIKYLAGKSGYGATI